MILKNSAFTLVELIVVVIILSILVGLSIFTFRGYPEYTRDAVRKIDTKNIEKFIDNYKNHNGNYPIPTNFYTGEIQGFSGKTWYIGDFGEEFSISSGGVFFEPLIDPKTGDFYYYALSTDLYNYRIIAKLEESGEEYILGNLIKCSKNYTKEGTNCIANKKICNLQNGDGFSTWNGNSWGECILSKCDNGYHLELENCLLNTKEIPCNKVGDIPENSDYNVINETVTWSNGSWSTVSNCSWVCKPGYTKIGNLCYSFSRLRGNWSSCDKPCGGVKMRYTYCRRSDGVNVDDSYCGERLSQSDSCPNQGPVTLHIWNGEGNCSNKCLGAGRTCTYVIRDNYGLEGAHWYKEGISCSERVRGWPGDCGANNKGKSCGAGKSKVTSGHNICTCSCL